MTKRRDWRIFDLRAQARVGRWVTRMLAQHAIGPMESTAREEGAPISITALGRLKKLARIPDDPRQLEHFEMMDERKGINLLALVWLAHYCHVPLTDLLYEIIPDAEWIDGSRMKDQRVRMITERVRALPEGQQDTLLLMADMLAGAVPAGTVQVAQHLAASQDISSLASPAMQAEAAGAIAHAQLDEYLAEARARQQLARTGTQPPVPMRRRKPTPRHQSRATPRLEQPDSHSQ